MLRGGISQNCRSQGVAEKSRHDDSGGRSQHQRRLRVGDHLSGEGALRGLSAMAFALAKMPM